MPRKRIVIDNDKFYDLWKSGFPDVAIAEKLNVSRTTIARKRKELNLPSNRSRGQRGPGAVRSSKPYHLEVKRLLKHLGALIYREAQKYRETNRNPEDLLTSWCATYISVGPIPQPILFPYVAQAEKTSIKMAKFAVKTEQQAERAGLVGVPGTAIIELAKVYKTASQQVKEELARKAVEEAGYVGEHETVENVEKRGTTKVSFYQAKWLAEKEQAIAWAPIKETRKRQRAGYSNYCGYGSRSKKNILHNIEINRALLGAKGY